MPAGVLAVSRSQMGPGALMIETPLLIAPGVWGESLPPGRTGRLLRKRIAHHKTRSAIGQTASPARVPLAIAQVRSLCPTASPASIASLPFRDSES